MLAALLATALAAAPVVDPLLVDSGAISDAEFLPLPDGRTAVVVHTAGQDRGPVVLQPADGVWQATPIPAGAVVAGPDGLHALVAWPHPLLAGRHWRLDGDALVRLRDLPVPPPVHGLMAVSADGEAVTAYATTGGVLERMEARGDGWRRRNQLGMAAFDDEGTVWLESTDAVQAGTRRHAAPPRPEGGARTFDESPDGEPTFLTLEPGRIRTWWRGAVHDHAVAMTHVPDPAGCVEAPCPSRQAWQLAPRSGRLTFDEEGPVAAWVETVLDGDRTCQVGPQHPCDPAGPINTCPTGPRYDCMGPKGPGTRTLFVQRFQDGQPVVEAVPLDIIPERVVDIAVQDGAVSLLVVNAQARRGWGLYRVRLGAAGASPLPVRWPRNAHAADFDVDTLITAGFSVGRGTSPYVGLAAFEGGTLRTGGDTRGAAGVDLALPDAAGATLTVDADISEWHDGCGQPELLVSWGLRRWRLLLAADPPRLQVDHETPTPIAGPAHGARTWTLAVDEDGVSVSVDGAVVHEAALGARPEGPTGVAVGQRMSCGQPVGPAAEWRAVSVEGR